MEFNEFCDKVEKYIKEEKKKLNKKEPFEFLSEISRKAQFFILDNITELDITKNKSLYYEKTAKLINNINDITSYILSGNNNINIFSDKITQNIFRDPLTIIKNNSSIEGKYTVDSQNNLIDFKYKKTFEQYIHATSNVDTDIGQDKLLFELDDSTHKNIYIISRIINKKHNGILLKGEDKSLFNLLPFISMINKITNDITKKSPNENLYYFFKTPLIIINDPVWKDFSNDMIEIYSKDKIEIHDWFYSEYFEINQNIVINILQYLKEYTLKIISQLNISAIYQGLQKNELIILKQIYRLIKSVIFFMDKTENQDIDYKYKVDFVLKCIEKRDRDYDSLNLKIIQYTKRKNIDYNMMSSLLETQGFHNFFILKGKMDILRSYDKNISLLNFIYEICHSMGFSKKFKSLLDLSINNNSSLKDVIINNKDYFKGVFNSYFYNDIDEGLKIFEYFIFSDFPCFNESKIKFLNTKYKECLYLLYFLYIYKRDDSLKDELVLYSKRDFYNNISFINNHNYWKFILIGKMIFPKDFNTENKKNLNLRAIISKNIIKAQLKHEPLLMFYTNKDRQRIKLRCILQDYKDIKKGKLPGIRQLLYDFSQLGSLKLDSLNGSINNYYISDIEREQIKDMANIELSSYDIMLSDTEDDFLSFAMIKAFFDHHQPLPLDYAEYLCQIFQPDFIARLILSLDNKYKFLRDSLLWFISNNYRTITVYKKQLQGQYINLFSGTSFY